MKKIVLLLGLLFAMQTALMAQDTTGTVYFLAHLQSTFNLIIVNGGSQEIFFITPDDYNDGVTELTTAPSGINDGVTQIQIESTNNWKLTIEADDFGPIAPTSGGDIPINNLGVTITANGGYDNGSGEVVYTALPGFPQGLSNDAEDLIWHGTNPNAGDIFDNDYTLHWEMGTHVAGTTMNQATMFDQLADVIFSTGDFETTATLTLIQQP
ncbi:MAG: hypothetical protein M0Q51_03510 [Bacteroidales bacterium]|nr:hypothetical protein [Bacteroidales bacterium]